jgi:hypothetical protein
MNAALLNPSKYLKAVEFLGRDHTLTITEVKREELIREDNSKEKKGIVFFAETTKGWVLNVTNIKSLVAMWGDETDNWIGKKVVLYPEPSDMSDTGFAIRVRGSPDLAKDVTFTLKLARKKPRAVTLRKTGAKSGNGKRAAPAPAPVESQEPDVDPYEREKAAAAAIEEHEPPESSEPNDIPY